MVNLSIEDLQSQCQKISFIFFQSEIFCNKSKLITVEKDTFK